MFDTAEAYSGGKSEEEMYVALLSVDRIGAKIMK